MREPAITVRAAAVGGMSLLEAIGDVQSALANIQLCITRNSMRSKDHGPEGICQFWVLIPHEVH